MSHLSLPRIHFKGKFVVNSGTGNNEDTMHAPTMIGSHVKVNAEAVSRRVMESLGPLRGDWNYYGDNECYFDDAHVTSVERLGKDKGRASRLSSSESDPLVGARVGLNSAVMVEVNTLNTRGTQIFADEFVIQKSDPPAEALLCKGQPTPSYVRWYNRTRNLGTKMGGFTNFSAIFQFCLPRASLLWKDNENSPVLAELHKVIEDERVQGLTVRICLYIVSPTFEPNLKFRERQSEMARLFALGVKVENLAIGKVVGTVGPWYRNELTSVTLGRLLINRNNKKSSCGPVVAIVDEERQVVTLDLANSFPEKGEQLEKLDMGRISLVVKKDREYEVGSVEYAEYNKLAYEAAAGVLEIPYEMAEMGERIRTGELSLRSSKLALPILTESLYMIDSDDRCIYMHKGEVRSFSVHARYLGQQDAERATLLDVASRKERSTAEGVALTVLRNSDYTVTEPTIVQVVGPQPLPIKPGQPAKITVKATEVGAALINFRADTSQPGVDFYINIRVLPDDSALDNINDEQLKFDLIYKEILQYYDLIHPAMTRVFDMSKDESWTPRWAKRVLARIDPGIKDRYNYMPRTRDMSDGRRRLLQRWCQHVIATRKEADKFNNPRHD